MYSIYLCIHFSICIFLSVHPSIHPSIHVRLWIYLACSRCIYSVYLSSKLSQSNIFYSNQFIYLSYLPTYLPTCLSISIHPSIYLSIDLAKVLRLPRNTYLTLRSAAYLTLRHKNGMLFRLLRFVISTLSLQSVPAFGPPSLK